MDVTLILPYYENPGMLREQLASVRDLPSSYRGRINVIVVDDGSPTHPALAEEIGGSGLQIYRIDVDVRWNQDAARNIGVNHCETEWMLLTDIDHLVPQATWTGVLNGKWDRDKAYKFGRVSAPAMTGYKPHPNSWFMTRKTYAKNGGYDERFAGFYGTDGDFRDRMEDNGIEVVMMKHVLVRVPRTLIADASTTTYLRKQPEDRSNIARIKSERAAHKDKKPRTLTFPYHRVFP